MAVQAGELIQLKFYLVIGMDVKLPYAMWIWFVVSLLYKGVIGHLISDFPDFLNRLFPNFWAFLSSVMAHSSESHAIDQVEDRYFMQKIQPITIGIVNELSFWLKCGVLLLQGVP